MKKIQADCFEPTARDRIHVVYGSTYHYAIFMFTSSIYRH
jgi:hypothetical protein